MSLQWKRAKLDTLPTCSRRTWESKCGQFKVEEHTRRLGGAPDVFYSMCWLPANWLTTGGYWAIIASNHRTVGGAQRACEAIARGRERRGKRATKNTG